MCGRKKRDSAADTFEDDTARIRPALDTLLRFTGSRKKRKRGGNPGLAAAREARWAERNAAPSSSNIELEDAPVLEDDSDKENDDVPLLKKPRMTEMKTLRQQVTYHKKTKQDLRDRLRDAKEETKAAYQDTRRVEKELQKTRAELQQRDETITGLKTQRSFLHRKVHGLEAKVSRFGDRLTTLFRNATALFDRRTKLPATFHLRTGAGKCAPVVDDVRVAFADLVAVDGVPANKVVQVFRRIGTVLGVQVEGDASRRTVGRCVDEAGNAAKLEFVAAAKNATGITLAGDGTSHKNETYESKFATIISDTSEGNKKLQFFLGLQMATNHTSETQRDGWIETVQSMWHLGYEAGLLDADDAREFWNLVTGFHSDHAEDQKKLFRLLEEYKVQCERDVRGEKTIRTMSTVQLESFLFKVTHEAVRAAGGVGGWDALSEGEKKASVEASWQRLVRDLGDEAFSKLSDEEKSDIDLFLWAGCCMHKEMNAFKGGVHGMAEFWRQCNLQRDSITATTQPHYIKAVGTAASERAEDVSTGGAVKLVSLCGAVFRHKDRKRGQQDSLRFFFDLELGFVICFPDSNNTRFQSHAEGCAVLITYLDLFIRFLTYVRENKGSRSLNHMEQNVFNGLHDIPTRHEICVITLYYLAVSVPYMREIRGHSHAGHNVLRLRELHENVIAHIDELIEHPELLLAADASYEAGAMDGKVWERPEAFYAVQHHARDLPHLRDLLVAFLVSAKVTWLRFSEEFSPDGRLASATLEQIERAWMEATNDLCEGSFGTFRQSSKMNPAMSLHQHNSRAMYKFNQTSDYLRALGPEMRAFLRRITRRQDASGETRAKRVELATHRQKVAHQNFEKDRVRKERAQAAREALDRITPILTVTELAYGFSQPSKSKDYLTVKAIDDQLGWHQTFGAPGMPKFKKEWGSTRADKYKTLLAAVDRYITSKQPRDIQGRLLPKPEPQDISETEFEAVPLPGFHAARHSSTVRRAVRCPTVATLRALTQPHAGGVSVVLNRRGPPRVAALLDRERHNMDKILSRGRIYRASPHCFPHRCSRHPTTLAAAAVVHPDVRGPRRREQRHGEPKAHARSPSVRSLYTNQTHQMAQYSVTDTTPRPKYLVMSPAATTADADLTRADYLTVRDPRRRP
ncbi:hypothetical protein GGX14DRAFT_572464 [Mycena pura]|uniref:Uncharacterized protein n=1 Tax=Mycena pura TaxID=153505 RepID=A0AAD6Y3X3_9AGAR|nr:hypothetical protein GGX14DRAFT_572464 [Mycena pura]